MKFYKKILVSITVLFMSLSFIGCSKIDSIKIKSGLKNNDFEYMKSEKVKQIVIQSTRDKGFRFVVTNKDVIKETYDILSSGKKVNSKSSLEPDYIFEVHEVGDRVHHFNYVAGLDKKEGGNLYNDEKIYIISSRIDNDILNNFENIRKPRNFKKIYYESILNTIDKYLENNKEASSKTIALNLKDDIDIQKFILSSDLEEFKNTLKSKYPNISITEKTNNSDIVLNIDTEGYKSTVYKSIITFSDSKGKEKPKIYYVIGSYGNSRNWDIKIHEDKKPENF